MIPSFCNERLAFWPGNAKSEINVFSHAHPGVRQDSLEEVQCARTGQSSKGTQLRCGLVAQLLLTMGNCHILTVEQNRRCEYSVQKD